MNNLELNCSSDFLSDTSKMIHISDYHELLGQNFMEVKSLNDLDFINSVSLIKSGVLAFECYLVNSSTKLFKTMDKTYLKYKPAFKQNFNRTNMLDVYNPNNGIISLNGNGNIIDCHYIVFLKLIYDRILYFKVEDQNTFRKYAKAFKELSQKYMMKQRRNFSEKIYLKYFINYQRMSSEEAYIEGEKLLQEALSYFGDFEILDSEELLRQEVIALRKDVNELKQEMKELKQEVKELKQEVKELKQEFYDFRKETNERLDRIEYKMDRIETKVFGSDKNIQQFDNDCRENVDIRNQIVMVQLESLQKQINILSQK